MSNKNWSVKVQVNPRRANEQGVVSENGSVFVWVEVQAENFKQAWANAQKQENGVVCDVRQA